MPESKSSYPIKFGNPRVGKSDLQGPAVSTVQINKVVTRGQKCVYTLFGLIFVGFAAVGAFLPVLPTTPFLILASACFMRSSPEWQRWLMRLPVWGPLLRDWQTHRAVKLRTKYVAIGMMVLAVSVSASVCPLSPLLLVVLFLLAIIGVIVVLRLPAILTETQSPFRLEKLNKLVSSTTASSRSR